MLFCFFVLSVGLFVCLFFSWSVCLSVSSSVGLFVCLFFSVGLFFHFSVGLFVCLSVCLFFCLSACLSVSHVSVNAAQLSLPTKLDNMHHCTMHYMRYALYALCIMICTMHYLIHSTHCTSCTIGNQKHIAATLSCTPQICMNTKHAMQSAVCPALKTHYCTMHSIQMLHFSGRLQEAVWVLFPSNYSSTDCFLSRRNRRPDLSPDIQTIQVTLECLLSIQLNSSSKVHGDYTASL